MRPPGEIYTLAREAGEGWGEGPLNFSHPHFHPLSPRDGKERSSPTIPWLALDRLESHADSTLRPILDGPGNRIFVIGVKRRVDLFAVDENRLDVLRIRNILRGIAAHDRKVCNLALFHAAVVFFLAP